MKATASGVIFNPWWEVPLSLSKEVAGKAGYVAVKGKDGKVQRWRQPPGPSNALGKVKFVMPNPKAIFLHDTNARGLFDRKMRAYSHGCIRTERVVACRKLLMQGVPPVPAARRGGRGQRRRCLDRGEDPGSAGQQEDGPGQLPEAAAGLHRLYVVGRARRRADQGL